MGLTTCGVWTLLALLRLGPFLQRPVVICQGGAVTNSTNEAQPSCSPARILLAEDDVDLRMLVSLKLRGAGFDVTEASDGQDLLERLIDGYSPDGAYDPFDMVLSDINMPHFNALDVMVGARS
jgi:PleD family two-component response regulator